MPTLLKPDYEKDVVYLVQFPRAKCTISFSPFCLKLETFLRMADIKYENIDNKFSKLSTRKQAPFVEFNGEHIPDSELIMDRLCKHFNLKDVQPKSDEEIWQTRALTKMIEGSLFWTQVYDRALNLKDSIFHKNGWGDRLPQPMKALKPIVAWKFGGVIKTRLQHHGYGRLTQEEVDKEAHADLRALSVFLGKKQYMLGKRITTLDATAFSVLCQMLYGPHEAERYTSFVCEECGNLMEYVERIKKQYWPDWDSDCENNTMTSDWKAPKQ